MNMESRQKYIEAKGYDVTDDFMDSFTEINLPLAMEIAKHIEQCFIPQPKDFITSHMMGGVIIYQGDPVPFAIEVIQLEESDFLILSDIKLIEMDELLDLINLNLYIKKDDERTQGHSTKEHS